MLLTGCGAGDGDPEGADAEPAAEPAERGGQERDGGEAQRGDGEEPEELTGTARRILDACEQIVRRAPGLSDERRRELIADCEAAARGDERALRKAATAACDAIAAATVPAPVRGPAADACKNALPSSVP